MLELIHKQLATKCVPSQTTIRWLVESEDDQFWIFVTTLVSDTVEVRMCKSISGVRFEDHRLQLVATIQDAHVTMSQDIRPFLDSLRLCECASGMFSQTSTAGKKLPCECGSFWLLLENFLERYRFDPILGPVENEDDDSFAPKVVFGLDWVFIIETELRAAMCDENANSNKAQLHK